MRAITTVLATGCCAVALSGCGGGGGSTAPASQDQAAAVTVTVPATITLGSALNATLTETARAGDTILAPEGTQITLPANGATPATTITLDADNETMTIPAGSLLTVRSGTTGAADNTLTVSPAGVIESGPVTITLNGSANSPQTTTATTSGETIRVPAGTQIVVPSTSSTINVSGDNNTISVPVGAVITVPAGATGPADNTITIQ